ncbi:MAG: CvpA family protein [Endomicrobiales bacterium]|nr:CvpA family protein [Endomicrobiales bacterium]
MFNIFDSITLIIIVLSTYFGFRTGVVASLFYVLSGFIGMWAAQTFAPEPKMNFYLVFIATAGVVSVVGFVIKSVLKKLFLGWLDHTGGIILGFLLGLVIVSTVLFPVSYHLPKKMREKVVSSFLGRNFMPVLQETFPKVRQFKIDDIKEKIKLPEIPDKLDLKVSVPIKRKK